MRLVALSTLTVAISVSQAMGASTSDVVGRHQWFQANDETYECFKSRKSPAAEYESQTGPNDKGYVVRDAKIADVGNNEVDVNSWWIPYPDQQYTARFFRTMDSCNLYNADERNEYLAEQKAKQQQKEKEKQALNPYR